MHDAHPKEKIREIEQEPRRLVEVAEQAAEAVIRSDSVGFAEWITNYTGVEETVVIEGGAKYSAHRRHTGGTATGQ